MTHPLVQLLEKEFMQTIDHTIPDFWPGDVIVVQVKIEDSGRSRIQSFEGLVIARNHGGYNASFTVRKISYGVGVERVFQLYSPLIAGIDVKRRGKVRRAKLYYMRQRTGKAARIEERLTAKTGGKRGAAQRSIAEEAIPVDTPMHGDDPRTVARDGEE